MVRPVLLVVPTHVAVSAARHGRFLYLPGPGALGEPAKCADHRLVLPGSVSLLLPQIIYDAAHTHVFHHPEHDPLPDMALHRPRLPGPEADHDPERDPQYVLVYEVLAPHLTIEKRWTSEHPPRGTPQPT